MYIRFKTESIAFSPSTLIIISKFLIQEKLVLWEGTDGLSLLSAPSSCSLLFSEFLGAAQKFQLSPSILDLDTFTSPNFSYIIEVFAIEV